MWHAVSMICVWAIAVLAVLQLIISYGWPWDWSLKLRWPRGRYNGDRIDGFKVSLRLHLLWWHWRPLFSWRLGTHCFIWLCFTVRHETSYENH